MGQPRRFLILLGAAAAAVAVVRHGRRAEGRRVPGGILIGDAAFYDASSRLLLGPLIRGSPPTSWPPPRTAPTCSRWAAGPATSQSGWLANRAST